MRRPPIRDRGPELFANEGEFQATVLELCERFGVLAYHNPDSRRSTAGFPDLVLAGRRGTLFRELKTNSGRVSPEQQDWLGRLTAGGENASVWRPLDWPKRVVDEVRAIS